jgi:hypothetical protein
MSEASYDVIDSDSYDSEAESFGDAYDWDAEGESYEGEGESYGENSRARARAYRRARHQQIVQARQRDATRRGVPGRPGPRPAPPRVRPNPATITAIREVDLEAKVSRDSMRRALDLANRRAGRATYSAVAGVAVNQALDTFEDSLDGHPFIRAALRWAPLAVLPANENLRGAQKYLLHPATVGVGIIGAVVIAGRLTTRSHEFARIAINAPASVANNQEAQVIARAVDRDGSTIDSSAPRWVSLNDKATILDAERGTFKAVNQGTAIFTVTIDGHTETAFVEVK